MAKNQDGTTLFRKLNRLFKNSNQLRRKIKSKDTALVVPDKTKSSGVLLFQKSTTPSYATITSNAYNLSERLMRYQDFCECEYTPELASALDIYSSEICSTDANGRTVHVYSENEKIKDVLDDLFSNILNIEFNLPSWARNICKYGDCFLYTDVSPEYGIMNVFPIPVNEIEREENYDRDDPFAVRFRWVSLANRILENWEVAHFRLMSNDSFLPYGSSILEPARRIWRQLILAEDSMLVYRVVRSPDRRVFYIDVGNLPADEVEGYMEQQKRNLRSNQIADSTTNRVDLRYNAQPIHKDTPIPLLDGRTVSIKDVAKEFDEGKENWVYSINDQTQNIVPGKVVWCGKNYSANKLTKIWLDDDSYVLTAPEHPFILRDGKTKRADELVESESLMPFYRKIDKKGYEECYTPGDCQYIKTHQIVAKNYYPYEGKTIKNRTTHHNKPWEQNNKLNNLPSNLTLMTIWDHRKWHTQNLEYTLLSPTNMEASRERLIKWNKSDKKKQRVSCLNKQRNSVAAMAGYNGSDLHKQHNEIRRQAQINSWSNLETKVQRSKNMHWIIPEECVEITKQIFLENQKISRDKLFKLVIQDQRVVSLIQNANVNSKRKIEKFSIVAFYEYMLQNTYSEFKKTVLGEYKNHKVSKVEHIEVSGEDVFCMTVVGPNGENDRHNFAVCGLKPSLDGLTNIVQVDGIIIKNSAEEDFFIATRGSDSGTKIEALQGGQNATAVDDVKYLQQKMISALKIPASYLGYTDNMSSKSSLAQLDVRFSRTISMIQKVIVSELNKLAVIHLFAHGFSSDDLINFSIKLTNPSSIAEQQKLQLWRDRFEIADSAPKGLLSNRWISKNILTLTDYDIREIKREQELEGGASDEESGGGFSGGGGTSSSAFADSIFGDNEDETDDTTLDSEAGETPGKEGEEEIKAGIEPLEDEKDDEIDLILSSDDNMQNRKFPLKPSSRVNQASKHRQTVRHNKSGRADIGMSTNNEIITAFDSNDVFDSDFFRDTTKNNLIKIESVKHRTTIAKSPDMIALFEKMKKKGFGSNRKNVSSNLLSEGIEIDIDIQDEIDNTTTNVEFEGINIVDDTNGSK